MRKGLIHAITYALMLLICFIIYSLIDGHSSIVPISMLIGWFSFPLIKYLQDER